MKTVSFTDFRKDASRYLSDVENGDIIKILRHGKAIAKILPIDEKNLAPAWKKMGLRIISKGGDLSSAILEAREKD